MRARHRDVLVAALERLNLDLDEDEIEYVASGAVEDDERGTTVARDEFVDFSWPVFAARLVVVEARARAMAGEIHDAFDDDEGTSVDGAVEGATRRAPVFLGEGWDEQQAAEKRARDEERSAAGRMFVVNAMGTSGTLKSSAEAKEKERSRRQGERLAAEAERERKEMREELSTARAKAARLRVDGRGKTLANVDLGPFNLPNPGGGVDLIEDASLTLTPGRRYGLIGRNGKGKSTLLKHIAARRVKGIDDSYSVHYVTQEVELDEDEESMLPGEIVLRADLQRGLLLDEQARLESSEDANELARLQEINAKLDAIGAASAPARVAASARAARPARKTCRWGTAGG